MNLPFDKSSEWFKLFPKLAADDNNNYYNSLNYIKQLTTIAVSSISFLNKALPRDSFTEETFEGVKLRILRKMCNNETAQFLRAALMDAFVALDKRYLGTLALCIYEDECEVDRMIESHVFEYVYSDDAVSMTTTSQGTSYSFENVRQQTVDFIRHGLAAMQSRRTRSTLPATYELGIRLYYNEAAPDDYHAPGYSAFDGADHLQHMALEGRRAGGLRTAFNQLSLLSFARPTVHAEPTVHAGPTVHAEPTVHAGTAVHAEPTIHAGTTVHAEPTVNACEPTPISLQSAPMSFETEQLAPAKRARARIACPCGKREDNDTCTDDELLTCQYCGTRQHAACFGVFGAADADAASLRRHCCAACRDADDSRAPTDLKLVPLSHHVRANVCLLRRVLKLCTQRESVNSRAISERFRLTDTDAAKVMATLHRKGIIASDPGIDSHKLQNISEEHLKMVLLQNSNQRENDLVDRLIEEVLSQESRESNRFDGLQLTALEMEDLSNTSLLGRMVENSVKEVGVEDPILDQYKKVFIEGAIDDSRAEAYSKTERYGKRKQAREPLSDIGNKRKRLMLIKKKNP